MLRIEDIDPPRAQPGADELILSTLAAFGFEWDGPVRYQSTSHGLHQDALHTLMLRDLAYLCSCSRSELEGIETGSLGPIYPGTCRSGASADATAVRLRTDNTALSFDDGLQGPQSQHLEADSGDFIIRRKDGLIAYQLAVVVDDADQGVTDIVRGIDLMDSTPRQIWLQRLLGYATPNYLHIPIAVNPAGQKLSKSHGADGVSPERAANSLFTALRVLQQSPPPELNTGSLAEIWLWALQNWKIDRLQGKTELQFVAIEPEKNP